MDVLELFGLTPRLGLMAVAAGIAAALLVAGARFLQGTRQPARGIGLGREP